MGSKNFIMLLQNSKGITDDAPVKGALDGRRG